MNNKIFKRIAALFTAVCILMFEMCSLAGNSESEIQYAPVEQESIYKEFDILRSLKITGEYNRSDFLPYENITLGEFYGMVLNIAGENSVKNIRDNEEIKTVVSLWGESVAENKLSTAVSCVDAVKVLLELSGNIHQLKRNKKKPTSNDYMTAAATEGIIDGIKINAEKILDRLTAMRLILNVIDAEYTEVVFFSNKQIKSIKKTERTVIEEYRKIYEIKGTVTETPDASLYGESEISDGLLGIDGKIYKSEKDYGELLGFKTVGYAQYSDTDMGKVLYLEKSKQQKVIEIDAKDIELISPNLRNIKYYSSGKRKTATFLPALRVIYNGAHLSKFTSQDLMPETGSIVLIDNNNDGKHEVIKVTDYTVIAVASLNTGEKTIFGRIPSNGDAENFYYGDFEKIDVYKNGESVKLSEIKRTDVLNIIVPKSFEARLKIYISDKVITGTVEAIDNNEDVLTLDGNDYAMSAKLLSEIKNKQEAYPETGKDYVLHFDVLGEIVFCDFVKESTLSYAYMRAMGSDGKISKIYEMRIFTTDSKWYTKELSERVKLNGKTITDGEVYNAIAVEKEFSPMLIMFGLNSEGKVNRIETPVTKEGVDEERLISGGSKTRTYESQLKSLGIYDVNLGPDTQIMVVPDDYENEDSYVMMSTNRLSNNTSYLCTPYNLDKFRVAELIIMNENDNLTNGRYQSEMCVVTNKVGVRNSEGYMVEGLKVNSGSYSDLIIPAADGVSFADVKVGDVISAKFNNRSEAEAVRTWFSSSDGVKYLYPATTNATNQILSGRVIDINDDRSIIRVECDGKEYCMRTMSGGTSVAFYNYDTNEARTGTFAEVSPGDFIVFKMTEMLMNRAVVLENLN